MLYESSSVNSISGSAMIVGLQLTHTFSQHYTTLSSSDLSSSLWHISHFRSGWMLKQCAPLTPRVVETTARRTHAICGGIPRINLLPEQQLGQSYTHLSRLSWRIFRVTNMPCHYISQLIIFDMISAVHRKSGAGFLLGWSHVPRKVPKTLTKHGIPWLELCCLNLGILNSLALAWNGNVQMDSCDIVTLFWLPELGIIQNKSRFLKSHITHARYVKFGKVGRSGINPFDHSTTQETSTFTQSCWRTIILMLLTL